MRIFISSARKGLEDERDSLAGLITALGHTPVRFEDFSAQETPSREACLKALQTADVCLFLLGPNYGHIFPETGQSATHDEWVAAVAQGMPRLVYRKSGARFEPAQHAFVRTVEAYATGVFRDTFDTTQQLQIKVAARLRELESATSALAFTKLTQPVDLQWVLDEDSALAWSGSQDPLLEVHVLPLDFHGYSARELEQLNTSLPNRIRTSGKVGHDVALTPSKSAAHAAVSIPARRLQSWNEPRQGELAEVRLYKSGQLTVRASLPRDGLGAILDPIALPEQLTELLQFAGALNIVQHERIVVATAVSKTSMVSLGTFDPHRERQRVRLAPQSGFTLRTDPDETVTLTALSTGAQEVATSLARLLISQHPHQAG
ncbi:DUF4062 domain-containing protein [Streptomyces sp. NPDC087212]|uniref:DUF4062 domain-containing protein n=1 Tax=Streptomyces sp. NPDC087212 TaxID=3365766 RepID=UPI00381EF09E